MAYQDEFSTIQVCQLLGLTPRQVDYWDRTKLIKPSITPAFGSGSARRYSFTDLVRLKTVCELRRNSVSLQMIRKALAYLGDRYPDLTPPIAQLRLLAVDGQFYVVQTLQEVESLRKRGQLILEVRIGKYAEELCKRVEELRNKQKQINRWIEIRLEVQAGTPVVKGTRIPLKTVAKYLRAGYTPAQICADLPTLTEEAIEAVRSYYEGKRGRPIQPGHTVKAK
jgi:uncharacterized protein (DUF433 family)